MRRIIGLLLAIIFAIAPLLTFVQPVPVYATSLQLLGTTSVNNSSSTHSIWYSKFAATASGNVTAIKIYATSGGSGTTEVGIYNDNAGQPGTLLAVNNTSTSVTSGSWITIPLTSTAHIVNGTSYWLASRETTVLIGCATVGGTMYTQEATSLPSTATAVPDVNWPNAKVNIQGWQISSTLSATTISGIGYTAPNYYATLNSGISTLYGDNAIVRGFVWSTSASRRPWQCSSSRFGLL